MKTHRSEKQSKTATLKTRLQRIWTNRWAGVVLAGICIVTAACFFRWVPPPGVSVGVMGVVAVLVSLRTHATGTEKVVWMLLILAFLTIEIRAIKKDRLLNAAEEKKHFGDIQQSMKNGFEESVKTSTGGDSYCYLNPPAPTAAILVSCPGKYPLYDLEVHVVDRNTQAIVWEKTIGDVAANTFKAFPDNLPFGDSKQNFIAFFGARNGFWTELLHYRKRGDVWACATLVYRSPNQDYPNGLFITEFVDPTFPAGDLKQDDDWILAEKRPHLQQLNNP